jgi:pyruvate/2-oxoglutarate dehydrogenase complex dihydrolipoamide dehydrogenase (E3) component
MGGGDVVRGPMLAHKAEEEGISSYRSNCRPAWVYQYHSFVGDLHQPGACQTEEQLKAEGRALDRHFPLSRAGRWATLPA